MKEIRKDLEFSSDYEISNYGYIISKPRKRWNGKAYFNSEEKILRTDKHGSIVIDNKYIVNIFSLLAENFLEYPKEFPKDFYVVKFLDGNSENRRIDNLKLELSENSMRVFDMEGNWLEDISNINDFCKIHNISSGNPYRCAKGFTTHVKGFQFRYIKEANQINKIYQLPSLINRRRSDTTPIAKYWKDKLICVYNSITEASENNDVKIEEIWESYERGKIIKGFLFKKIV